MTEVRKRGSLEESIIGILTFALGGTVIVALMIGLLSNRMNFGFLTVIFVGMLLLSFGLQFMIRSAK